jgi:hypothetical protein
MPFIKTGRLVPNCDYFNSSGSQSNGSIPPVILGRPWSTHFDQVRKKAAQSLGTRGSLLSRRNNLSIRYDVLLYKQLIRPMMDYACPDWRSAARSHIKKLQVLRSKCLRIATNAPWYTGNKQIDDDLGVPYCSDHIRHKFHVRLFVQQILRTYDMICMYN